MERRTPRRPFPTHAKPSKTRLVSSLKNQSKAPISRRGALLYARIDAPYRPEKVLAGSRRSAPPGRKLRSSRTSFPDVRQLFRDEASRVVLASYIQPYSHRVRCSASGTLHIHLSCGRGANFRSDYRTEFSHVFFFSFFNLLRVVKCCQRLKSHAGA